MTSEDRIYIEELARLLVRSTNTIRQWLRREDFPSAARPSKEGGRGKFFWTKDQLSVIEEYASERSSARGWDGWHKRQQVT